MKTCITLLILMTGMFASGQLRQKTVEKPDGSYTYCYHSNGKESTLQFWPKEETYGTQGYSKAWDKNGNLIYEANSGRTGQICGTTFSYYENGAIRSAEYSSHPDAGIQWYRKTTYYDENGQKTGEVEQSHDDRVTLTVPDYAIPEEERVMPVRDQRAELLNRERTQFVKDSTLFFTADTIQSGDTLRIISPQPESNSKLITDRVGKKQVRTTQVFFQQKEGVLSITRTYHKNGRVAEEWLIEAQACHYRSYSKKGHLVTEKLNQPCPG